MHWRAHLLMDTSLRLGLDDNWILCADGVSSSSTSSSLIDGQLFDSAAGSEGDTNSTSRQTSAGTLREEKWPARGTVHWITYPRRSGLYISLMVREDLRSCHWCHQKQFQNVASYCTFCSCWRPTYLATLAAKTQVQRHNTPSRPLHRKIFLELVSTHILKCKYHTEQKLPFHDLYQGHFFLFSTAGKKKCMQHRAAFDKPGTN